MVRIEGIDDRLTAEIARASDDRLHDCLMPNVEAVEVPDRQNRTIERVCNFRRPPNQLQC